MLNFLILISLLLQLQEVSVDSIFNYQDWRQRGDIAFDAVILRLQQPVTNEVTICSLAPRLDHIETVLALESGNSTKLIEYQMASPEACKDAKDWIQGMYCALSQQPQVVDKGGWKITFRHAHCHSIALVLKELPGTLLSWQFPVAH